MEEDSSEIESGSSPARGRQVDITALCSKWADFPEKILMFQTHRAASIFTSQRSILSVVSQSYAPAAYHMLHAALIWQLSTFDLFNISGVIIRDYIIWYVGSLYDKPEALGWRLAVEAGWLLGDVA